MGDSCYIILYTHNKFMSCKLYARFGKTRRRTTNAPVEGARGRDLQISKEVTKKQGITSAIYFNVFREKVIFSLFLRLLSTSHHT